MLLSENSEYLPDKPVYNSSLGSDTTLNCIYPATDLVYNPTAARAITLDGVGSYYFPIGYKVTVHNVSAGFNLTFELVSGGGTSTITPQASKTFMCTGSNTFIEIY